jgi:RND family efflux transporter MFP subunit
MQAARSGIVQREAELKGARAAEDFRQVEVRRLRALEKNAAVAQALIVEKEGALAAARAQVAAATAALTTAKADLEVKQGKLAQAEAGVATAEVNVRAADIDLDKARYSLGLTKIVAPFDGIVTERNHRNGQYLRVGEGEGRRPLLTIQRTDQLRVQAVVAERDAPKIKAGTPVELRIDALPGARFAGTTISRTAFAVDPGTSTMRVEIDVANPNEQVRPGMFGRVTIVLRKEGEGDGVRVPKACLVLPSLDRSPHVQVYVVQGGKAHLKRVELGRTSGGEVEILSGLKAGDLVVADPKGLKGDVVAVEVRESR